MHWVEMLPDTQTPSWLGLPSNAEKVLLTTQGTPQSIITIIGTGPSLSFFSSVNLQGFHAYLGSIINHLSLYSTVNCHDSDMVSQCSKTSRCSNFCVCIGQNNVPACVMVKNICLFYLLSTFTSQFPVVLSVQ